MILTIIFYGKKTSVLHHETNFYKINFSEMVYIKIEGINSINKITDIENLNKSYNMLLDLFFLNINYYYRLILQNFISILNLS